MDNRSSSSNNRSIDPAQSDNYNLPDFHKSMYRGCLHERADDFSLFINDVQARYQTIYETIAASGPKPSVEVLSELGGQAQAKLSFNSNNYLGFSLRPEVLEAARQALAQFGSSSGGSPLLSGTLSIHKELEEALSAFLGKEDTMLFTSGYAANVGAIAGLVGPHDVVLVDKLVHASVIDGVMLARARMKTFRHNDVNDLERKLAEVEKGAGVLVVIDGVYSMEGTIAPLDEIVALKKKSNFVLMVDDAHAVGTIGVNGRGTASHFNVNNKVDLVMGTLSKALSSAGAFLAGSQKFVKYLRYFARSSMYSSNIAPASAAGALASLALLGQEGDVLVTKLRCNIKRLREGLRARGLAVKGHDWVPIIIVPAYSDLISRQMASALQKEGLLINAIPAPVVSKGQSCLRIRVTVLHSDEQIDYCIEAIAGVLEEYRPKSDRAGQDERQTSLGGKGANSVLS